MKLANRGVRNGIVTLNRETLVRLMREAIRQHLEELPEAPVEIKNQFEGPITELIGSVSKAFVERIGIRKWWVGERQAEAPKELGRFDLAKAPPCFNTNLLDLQAENLAHPSTLLHNNVSFFPKSRFGICNEVICHCSRFQRIYTRYQVGAIFQEKHQELSIMLQM